MNLTYTYQDLSLLLADKKSADTSTISHVVFDSRRISNPTGAVFFALEGVFRNGHDFIEDAYQKGVRHFVVSNTNNLEHLSDIKTIVVPDTLKALQQLARHHRDNFSCKVVAITGSNGKTTVKEWLSQLLSHRYNVVRSPKSYNSSIGIPISLLEITKDTDIAIIEVGVPEKGQMSFLADLIQPTHGILTSFGSAHRSLFKSEEEHFNEKLRLFEGIDDFLYPSGQFSHLEKGTSISVNDFNELLQLHPNQDRINQQNASLAIAMSKRFDISDEVLTQIIPKLNPLALRLETFNGVNDSLIINDTYSLDNDSLRLSLEYQLAHAEEKKRIVIIGIDEQNVNREDELKRIIAEFQPDEVIFHYPDSIVQYEFSNSIILIKGNRNSRMERVANQLKLQHHQTYLEIDLTAIRHNINYHKSLLKPETKLLCMIKASSYGADAKTMGRFLEGMGIDYLGVAYPSEGIQLRESGVSAPIFVMNCEERFFNQCIDYGLEPGIFNLQQLNSFIKELINRNRLNFPIHIKLETGMNRLGFTKNSLPALIDLLKGQPEVEIKSIYSHLAESDAENSEFTIQQINTFSLLADQIENQFNYPIIRHILNSSGIQQYTQYQFDMVRLGIGMYGSGHNPNLQPALSWFSTISQIKHIEVGESVGYGRSFIADAPTTIAIIPVGYADGFRRSLSQGNGGVYIHKKFCPTIGNVCMDMIMVDVTALNATEGDRVEIIGPHQSIQDFARQMDTIPYEVMTGLSMRMHRQFIDQ